jgi:hypothetical protein
MSIPRRDGENTSPEPKRQKTSDTVYVGDRSFDMGKALLLTDCSISAICPEHSVSSL